MTVTSMFFGDHSGSFNSVFRSSAFSSRVNVKRAIKMGGRKPVVGIGIIEFP